MTPGNVLALCLTMNLHPRRTVIAFAVACSTLAIAGCSSSPSSPGASSNATAPETQAAGSAAGSILIQGTVSQLSASCPQASFLVGSTIVVANEKTTFPTGSCQQLVFAQRVDVTGTHKGHTLTATSIKQLKNKDGA